MLQEFLFLGVEFVGSKCMDTVNVSSILEGLWGIISPPSTSPKAPLPCWNARSDKMTVLLLDLHPTWGVEIGYELYNWGSVVCVPVCFLWLAIVKEVLPLSRLTSEKHEFARLPEARGRSFQVQASGQHMAVWWVNSATFEARGQHLNTKWYTRFHWP